MNPEDAPHLPYVGLEHIDPGNTRLSRWGQTSSVRSSKSHFYANDVLYGKLRPYLDKAVLSEREGICSTDILVLSPKAQVDPAFLSYLLHLRYFVNHAIATTTGVNHPRTSWASIREFETQLPPLKEQEAIAHVLSTVQKAIETTEQVTEATRELKRSLMNHLFTYGPVPVDEAEQVPLKETEIGPVPEQWETVNLGTLIAEGPQNGIYKPQSLYGAGTLIVRIDDFSNEGGTIDSASNSVRLSAEELDKYGLNPYDILVNRVNSLSHLGKTTMVGEFCAPAVFESNMMRFTVDEDLVYPEYVARFLSSSIAREQMRGRAKRAVAQSSINQGDVRSIFTPLPPLADQEGILHIVRSVDSKTVAEESRKQSLEVLFKTLLHNLMTGKVRAKDFDLSEVEQVV